MVESLWRSGSGGKKTVLRLCVKEWPVENKRELG